MTVALTNKDLSTVPVWQVACLYVGTAASPAPTSGTSPLDATYHGLGFIAPAGIVESTGQTFFEPTVYEGNVARSVITAGSWSMACTLAQNIQATLEAWYNSQAGTDGGIVVDPLSGAPKLPWVLDLEDDAATKRIYAPAAQGRRNGDVTYVKTAESGFPLLVMAFADPSLPIDVTTGRNGCVKIWDSSVTPATA